MPPRPLAPPSLASLGPRPPTTGTGTLGQAPAHRPLAPPPQLQGSRSEARPVLTTSKEWIIPARPKPGRKPAQVEPDSSKKAVNRASQRAFRERRQEYVAELEDKVRALEQGEGEKAVFFQQQALKAKQESAKLRADNDNLCKIIQQLRAQLAEQPQPLSDLPDDAAKLAPPTRRRSTGLSPIADDDSQGPPKRPRRASTRTANGGRKMYRDSPPLFDEKEVGPVASTSAITMPAAVVPSCGYCTSNDGCFCESVGYKVDHHRQLDHTTTQTIDFDAPVIPVIKVEDDPLDTSFQVAVPLRLRRAPNATKKASVWAITPAASSAKPALCNGDPANCPACQDDPFGKAFCNALSNSVCNSQPCEACPSHNRRMPTPPPEALPPIPAIEIDDSDMMNFVKELPCCGDPEMCGSLTCGPKGSTTSVEVLPRSVPSGVRTVETVPCNEAWQTLKGHPNIAFANLTMLAEVISKRTTCDGPVSLSPEPATVALGSPSPLGVAGDASHLTVCAADAGPRKRLTVERGAVNEALQVLDRWRS